MAQEGAKRGIVVSTLGNLAGPIAALVSAPILAQVLGAAGRGELAAATAPLFLAASGLTLGLPEAVTYLVARAPARRLSVTIRACLILLVVGGIGSLVIALLSPILSGGSDEVADLILLAGLALVPTLVVSVVRGLARGLRRWTLLAVEQVISALLRLSALVVCAVLGVLDPFTAMVITVGSTIVSAVVYLPLLRTSRHSTDDGKEPRGSLLRFGLGVWVGSAAGIVLARLDQTLVLPLSSAEQLGIYAVAVSLADAVRVFNKAVRDVVFAEQSAKNDDGRMAMASRCSTIITTATAVAVLLISIPVIPWLFGSEFADAVPVLAVILLGTVIGNPGSIVAAGLSARGRPILRSIALLCGVAINLIGLVVLVPMFGAMGAAIASAAANGATGWIVLWFARRYFGLHPQVFLRFERKDMLVLWNGMKQISARLKRGKG